jgi:hypothetical protein
MTKARARERAKAKAATKSRKPDGEAGPAGQAGPKTGAGTFDSGAASIKKPAGSGGGRSFAEMRRGAARSR